MCSASQYKFVGLYLHSFPPCSYNSVTLSLSFVTLWMTAYILPLYSILSPSHPLPPTHFPSCSLSLALWGGRRPSPEHLNMDWGSEWAWETERGEMCVCVCIVCPAWRVSLSLSSGVCAANVGTVRVFCCKVNGELTPPHSTAGSAVSDKRVSAAAAAAADQASLPGLGTRGSETHTGTNRHPCAHSCVQGQRLLAHTNTHRHAYTHSTPPALGEAWRWTLDLRCVDSHPALSPTLLNASLSNCEETLWDYI